MTGRLAVLAFTFPFLAPVQNFQKASLQGTVTATAAGITETGTFTLLHVLPTKLHVSSGDFLREVTLPRRSTDRMTC